MPVMPCRRADHPGPRPGKLVPRRSPVVPSCRFDGGKPVPVVPCRSSRATARNGRGGARPQLRTMRRRADRRRPVSGKVVPIDGGKPVPIIQGHGSQRPRWCPSCPSAIADNAPPCRSTPAGVREGRAGRRREAGADHPGPRLAMAAVVPVVPVRNCGQCAAAPIIDLAAVVPVVSIDSREAGADHPGPRPGKLVPRRSPVVPIDGGKVVPIIQGYGSQRPRWCPSAIADNAPRCRSTPAGVREGRADRRREGNAHHAAPPCRSSRATAWQRPRWCLWFPSCPSSTVGRSCRAAVSIDGGKLVPIIQGHGSQRPRWCPSCRSSTAGKVVPVVPSCRSTPARWCRSTAGR